MQQGRHAAAFESLCKLRFNKVQAARDQFYMYKGLEAEQGIRLRQSKVKEMITVPRNRRAMIGSEIVMFMQRASISSRFRCHVLLHRPADMLYRILRCECHCLLLIRSLRPEWLQ